ncbi:hypothetical protein PMI42_00379 [Bradyrhizobium sp. YR681]|uniref:recombinase family protein n=1 Tax=Bradyrhizobium sp. YR681 TaxID=1144344 RepID=UPI0002711B3F|nr:recombinase family protein [Bradyrhizobium sp. YR681]EJN16052.1 hypothetical protein PMI42_00379 [Bradyrhizobium sp. YR681]
MPRKRRTELRSNEWWRLATSRTVVVALLFGASACAAADFQELDRALSAGVRTSIAESGYYEALLKRSAADLGLTSNRRFFEGLSARQSVAQALDQIATSSFERQITADHLPRPEDLQILSNMLTTLASLEKVEAATGLSNDLLRVRTTTFSSFVSPLIARPGRKNLRPLAEPHAGLLLAQFIGKGANVRVLDLYAEPAVFSLAWSVKTFSVSFPDLKTISGRANVPKYAPRKSGLLGLYVDFTPLSEREQHDLLSQFDDLQNSGVIVIIDDSTSRMNSCVDGAREQAERKNASQQRDMLPPAAKNGKKSQRNDNLPSTEAAPLTALEIDEIRLRCQQIARLAPPYDRVALFDPNRNILIANFPNLASGSMISVLSDARYLIDRWPVQ